MITIDHTNNKFCPGPCNDIDDEPDIPGITFFKPLNGKRYEKIEYPLNNNNKLEIKHFRMCKSCIDRYYDMDDETMKADSLLILKKMITRNVADKEIKDYVQNNSSPC